MHQYMMMKPWQTSLSKAPSNKGGKEGTKERERERTQVQARRTKAKVGHYGGA
jgi:hypothetical protein